MAAGFGNPPKMAGRSRASFMGAGMCHDALPKGREGLGGTFREPGWDGRAGRCRKALPEGQEGSEGPSGDPEEIGRAGSGGEKWEGLGGPLGGTGRVGRSTQRVEKSWESLPSAGRGWETPLEERERSIGMGGVGSPYGRSGRIRRSSRRVGRGQEGRERFGVPPGGGQGR